MKVLTTAIKVLSLLAGGAAYADIIPAKFAPLAAFVFLAASALKDIAFVIGDYLDDKLMNKSFKAD